MKTKRPTFLRLTFLGWYILAVIIVVLLCLSCTDNTIAKTWGGTVTIELPKGMKLLEATWKGNNSSLWYLMAPMEDDYIPQEKVFQEDSRFGILEGTVIFKESK